MEILLNVLEYLSGLDLIPVVAGTVAGLYVQSAQIQTISIRRFALVIATSMATGFFIGQAICHYWSLEKNLCSTVRFLGAVYALDILDTLNTLIEYVKKNPHELIAKYLPKLKSNEKKDEN
jgi:hypothetical protein